MVLLILKQKSDLRFMSLRKYMNHVPPISNFNFQTCLKHVIPNLTSDIKFLDVSGTLLSC